MNTIIYYSVFIGLDFALVYPLYHLWRRHPGGWRAASTGAHKARISAALLIALMATLVWVFMTAFTVDSCRRALAGLPLESPMLLTWVLSAFLYVALMGIAGPLQSGIGKSAAQD